MKSLDEIIVYKDDNIVIINKPSFLLSQKDGTGEVSLEDYVVDYFHNKEAKLINRLDKDTTGLIVFGLNKDSIKYFNEIFMNHEKVVKKYLVLISGKIEEKGAVEAPMRKNYQLRKMVVAPVKNGGKYAITIFSPKKVFFDSTLLEVSLKTGRTHQIRVHMSYIRHHVIGDYKYGDFKVNNLYKNKYGITTQLLHSSKLLFNNLDGKYSYLSGKEFEAELPENFQKIIDLKSSEK